MRLGSNTPQREGLGEVCVGGGMAEGNGGALGESDLHNHSIRFIKQKRNTNCNSECSCCILVT